VVTLEVALSLEIKAELVRRGMYQRDLADAVGVGLPALNRYLQGHQSMPMPTFFKVAEVLGIAPSALLQRAHKAVIR